MSAAPSTTLAAAERMEAVLNSANFSSTHPITQQPVDLYFSTEHGSIGVHHLALMHYFSAHRNDQIGDWLRQTFGMT